MLFRSPINDPESENLNSRNLDFESLLFHFRKKAEAVAPLGTYFCSLSSRTVVYKGLLTPSQLPAFYADLRDSEFESSIRDFSPALFHQHPTQLVPGSAVPFCGTQRGNQYHQRQPALAARKVAGAVARASNSPRKFVCWKIGSATRQVSTTPLNFCCARHTARRKPCLRWFLPHGSVLPKQRPNCATFWKSNHVIRNPGTVPPR